MKRKVLLICALLISVITLSGAANRSLRTEMEQWNPIGFTQATNGMTQAPSGSPITNLTAGSAILPAVATAAPSGVLRSGSTNVITFTTAKRVGESIKLSMQYNGAAPTLSGATGTPLSDGTEVIYTLTSQTVTITGDVTRFVCQQNQLTRLDVSRNTALEGLDCMLNQLAALDVSENTALIWLFCAGNQLTALDVSQNTVLERLYCFDNQLTALDVSPKNIALTNLECYENQIKGEEMTRLVNSLPNLPEWNTGKFTVVKEPSPEGNRCLKSDVAIAKSKNWNTYKYYKGEYVAYEGEEDAQPLKVTLTKEGEGTITATGAADLNTVPEGTELTIVATPAAGYELKALTANGTDILATKKFTVTADTEVKATFTKKTAAEVVEAGTLRLYPNPASAYVNVKGAKANALVRLYDANGALRYEARTDADGTLQIDLSAYAVGTYLLLVGNDAQRLLIQR